MRSTSKGNLDMIDALNAAPTGSREFLHRMMHASSADMLLAVGQIHDLCRRIAWGEIGEADLEDIAHEVLLSAKEKLDADHGDPAPRARQLVQRAFAPLLERLRAADASTIALGVARDLENVLTFGPRYALPHLSILVAGDGEDFEVRSAARSIRREGRQSVSVTRDLTEIERSHTLILQSAPEPEDWLMAGAARQKGLRVIQIRPERDVAPWIEAATSWHEAAEMIAEALADTPRHDDGEVLDFIAKGGEPQSEPSAELRAALLDAEIERLRDSASFVILRRTAETEELRKLLKGSEFEDSFFQIIANGSPSGESPQYARAINRLTWRIEELEKELAEHHNDPDPEGP